MKSKDKVITPTENPQHKGSGRKRPSRASLQKWGLIAASIFLVFSIALFYINKVLLPVQVKAMVIKTAEEQLGRKVTLDTLQWGPIKGFSIAGLTIYSKDKPDEVFLHIDTASAQVLFLPILQKKIIIPSVKINAPSIRIVKLTADTWNFTDLIQPTPTDKKAAPTPDVIIGGISLTGGRIKISDMTGLEEFSEMIEPINIKGSVTLAADLHLTGNIAFPETQGTFKFDIRANLRDRNGKGDSTLTNIVLARYLRFLPISLPIQINSAAIKDAKLTTFFQDNTLSISGDATLPGTDLFLQSDMRLQTDLSLEKAFFTINLKNSAITLQGTVNSKKTILAMAPQQMFEGDIKANIASLTINANDITFNGSLSGQGVKFSPDEIRSFSGNPKISDATITIKSGQLSGTADLEIKNLIAQLGSGQKLQGDLTIPSIKLSRDLKGLSATADIKMRNLTLVLDKDQKLSGDVDLEKTQLEIEGPSTHINSNVTIKGLKAALTAIALEGDVSAPSTQLDLSEGKVDINADFKLKNATCTLPQNISFTGNPSATIHLVSDNNILRYAGNVSLTDGEMKGLPTVDTIKDIRGDILIATDKASTKSLTLTTLNTPVALSGEVTDFAKPSLKIDVSAQNVSLAIAEKLIPQIIKEHDLKASGKADIALHIDGAIAKLDTAKIIASVDLKDVALQSGKLKKELSKINGHLQYNSPTLSWKGLSAIFEDRTYTVNGYMEDFVNPTIATSLKGPNMSFDVQAKKTGDNIQIESLTGDWLDSSIDARGRVELPPGKEPVLDIVADGKLSLRDAPKILPQYAKEIEDLKIGGILKINASIKGKALDWKHWNANFTVTAPAFYAMGYTIEDLEINSVEKDGALTPLEIKGILYGGDFGAISTINLTDKNFPFETTFKLRDLDLNLFKRDTPLKEKQLAGLVTAAGELKGNILDWKNISGKTTTQITNGYLWDLAILSKILGILSSSFQGGDIIITDANATFSIDQGRVSTNNLSLKSDTVSLLGEGWVDLDQNIDFNVTPRIEPKGGDAFSVLNPTAGLLNIHITGTIRKPEFDHNVSAPAMIKKTLQNTVGNLLKIFE